MTNNLYCLRDNLSGRCGQVFVFATDELCLYTLRKSIKPSDVSTYLGQYEVLRIGTIDPETATVTPVPHKILNWNECPMLDIIENSEKKRLTDDKTPVIM